MSEYTVRAAHSSKLRERLPHPVIDTDGHIIEAPFVKIKAMFSSDLGHWDVLDFGDVLHEADEQVEHGLMGEDDFKDFVFTNPLTFQTRVNPDFFKGTAVGGAVAGYRAAAE